MSSVAVVSSGASSAPQNHIRGKHSTQTQYLHSIFDEIAPLSDFAWLSREGPGPLEQPQVVKTLPRFSVSVLVCFRRHVLRLRALIFSRWKHTQ